MISKPEMELIGEVFKKRRDYFGHNSELLDIYEGNLKHYVDCVLKNGLSEQAYNNSKDRIAPINVLTKIVDKLSTIYSNPPSRKVENGTEQDEDLKSWYEEKTDINSVMGQGTAMYNLTKSHLIQPYVNGGLPQLRIIPSDRFFVLSVDPVEPMKPTHVVTFDLIDPQDPSKVIFYAYTATGVDVFNQSYERQQHILDATKNPNGDNPIGQIPFVYANASKIKITPPIDTDVMAMTVLIPILLTDLNYAAKYQSFSMVYGIDVDDENLKFNPNSFLRFKSDPTSNKTPEIGMLKPEVDIDQVLGLIQSQLSLWLNTKGIRPGAVGKLDGDNFANGISKIIDEMDTQEYRIKLADYYAKLECQLWDLIIQKLHPYWVDTKQVDNTEKFSIDARVKTHFSLQLAAKSRADMVRELKAERDAGFISQKMALKKLNPTMSDEEIDALLAEIDGEKKAEAALNPPAPVVPFGKK